MIEVKGVEGMESKSKKRCCDSEGRGFQMAEETATTEVMDRVMESLLPTANLSLLLDSMERLLERHVNENEKNICLERWMNFGHHLQDTANRLTRQRASEHNSRVWPLTFELTVKVFSLLGTRNLCYVAASCSLFYKVAMDSACYVDVDLRTNSCNIGNRTVSRMVERAGQYLRSLKIGVLVPHKVGQVGALKLFGAKVDDLPNYPGVLDKPPHDRYSNCDTGMFVLTRSCLDFLGLENGAIGAILKVLHLFNIDGMDTKSLCKAISCCPSLTDLVAVGLHVRLREALQCLSCHCCNLEQLVFQPSENSQTLSELALSFNWTLVGSGEELLLESLILRDCMQLKKVEVEHFLLALSSGECRSLQHLDVSNKDGLAAANWFGRRFSPSAESMSRLQSQRPELCLVAEYPNEKRSKDSEAVQLNLQSPDFLSVDTSSSTDTTSSDYGDDDNNLEYFNDVWKVGFKEFVADQSLEYQFEFSDL